MDTEELTKMKKRAVADKKNFLKIASNNFLLYYQPLIP